MVKALADLGGVSGARPPRVQILSFRHTKFSKRNPARESTPLPPTGNSGSATEKCIFPSLVKISGLFCRKLETNFYFKVAHFLDKFLVEKGDPGPSSLAMALDWDCRDRSHSILVQHTVLRRILLHNRE